MSDYETGYGKPPKHTQFKPGQSGNPKGRPKGARGLKTDLREELSQRVSVTEGGRTRKISKQQLILKALVAKAAKGDVRAAEKVVSLQIQMFGFEDERTRKKQLSDNDRALLEEVISDRDTVPDTDIDPVGKDHSNVD